MFNRLIVVCLCFGIGITSAGCRSNAETVLIVANEEAAVVGLPMDQAWEAVRDSLLEKGYEVYTRDKRGLIIGYTAMKRRKLLVPNRTKFTIVLDEVTNESTQISIESVHQRYRVTFLTYPGWHDVEAVDDKELGHELMVAVQERASAVSGT